MPEVVGARSPLRYGDPQFVVLRPNKRRQLLVICKIPSLLDAPVCRTGRKPE